MSKDGMVRRGLVAVVVLLCAVVGVALVPTSASARVPTDNGTWLGAETFGVQPAPTALTAPAVLFPLPADSGSGRRIVYSQSEMHVWAVNERGHVVRDWKVSGRPDWP